MLSLILSLLLLAICVAGVILTISGMINSYLKKRLEYIAYRNQLHRSKHNLISTTENEDNQVRISEPESEEDYYKNHQLNGSNLNLAFLTKEGAASLLKAENIKDYAQRMYQDTKTTFKEFDYKLFWSKIKLNSIKLYKYILNKVKDIWKLFLTLTQPAEQNQNQMTVGELNKRLEKNNKSPLSLLIDEDSEFSVGNSKNTADIEDLIDNENQQGKYRKITNTDDLVDKIHHADLKINLAGKEKEMYQELENELLEKLQNNMSNLSIWESLGNFYLDNQEFEKCRGVFQYVLDHSQSTTQSNRIRKKLAEMRE